MKCPSCGANLQNTRDACQYCGTSQPEIRQPQPPPTIVYNIYQAPPSTPALSPKSRWAAFFLCLFLGYWGAHKFYLGKYGAGILYFLTVGLFGIGWFVDLILLLAGAATDKQGRRLR